jgi:hypothetical protein
MSYSKTVSLWACIAPVTAVSALGGCLGAPEAEDTEQGSRRSIAAIQPGEAAPGWFSIENPGEPISFEHYRSSNELPVDRPDLNCSPAYNCEVLDSPYDVHRPPVQFQWQPSIPISKETAAGGCAITDQPDQGIYYFDPFTGEKTGSTYPPHYVNPSPSMFTISQPYWGIRGLTFKGFTDGSAEGSPAGASAFAVVYATSNRCSSGNVEYGYFQNLAEPGRPVYAYYSDKTNCDGYGACRSQNSFASAPVYQVTSPITKFTNIRNFEGDDRSIYYSAYFIPQWLSSTVPYSSSGYVLRYAIIDGNHTDRFATCSINDAPPAACTLDVPVDSWYPVQKMIGGTTYVVAGTATSYPVAPQFSWGGSFNVNGLYLGR